MPAIFELNQFGELPLWAQALVAMRMTRRGVLTFINPDAAPHAAVRAAINRACGIIEACAIEGNGVHRHEPELDAAMALRDDCPRDLLPLCCSAWWSVDSARAAQSANDFPIDATVANSARQAIAALAQDRRIIPLQLATVFAADFDQVRFACTEARIGRYDGLTRHVLDRLAPVHPLTLADAPRAAEERSR